MTIHEKINSRSYYTTYLRAGRFSIPYEVGAFIYSQPRYYFNSSKSLVFNFKK